MTKVLLLRHGETDANAARRYQGQTDIPLNDVGREQARCVATYLENTPIDAIYASDLKRAYETAIIIAANRQIPVHKEPRLREFSFGHFEGLTYAEIHQKFPEVAKEWDADRVHVPPPGGESLLQAAQRAEPVLHEIFQQYPEQTVLVVSHGGILRLLACQAIALPLTSVWRLSMGNAALAGLSLYENTSILDFWNLKTWEN